MGFDIRHPLAIGAALSAIGCVSVAQAQESAAKDGPAAESAASRPKAEPEASDKIEQVIVTATRKPQLLQNVPLSITALSEKNLEAQGIRSFEDYAARTAGVHLSRDSSQSSFTIRGISATNTGDTTSATAGLYLDDYPIYDTWFRFSSPDIRIVDVQRIEVLRGPQGTLFGATSLSGSIRMITNKPDLENLDASFAGTLANTAGGGASSDMNAMLNVPLKESVAALRAVAYRRKDGGYVDNVATGRKDGNEQRTRGGRLALRLQPSASLDLLASVMYQRDESDDQSATYYFAPAGRANDSWDGALPSQSTSTLKVATLAADQKLGGGNLTATGIHAENDSANLGDATPIAFLLSGMQIATAQHVPSASKTNIFELRYTSDPAARLRYVVGAYYNARTRDVEQKTIQPAFLPILGTDNLYRVAASQKATEKAVFGEATWALTPEWDATVGLRDSFNGYHFVGAVDGVLNNLLSPLAASTTDTTNSQSSILPRFSVAYKPDPFVAYYATISKGYRFGLTNYNSGTQANVPLNYKSDTLWNYEVGAKTTVLGGRGTVNTSLYYIAWHDLQVPFRNANNQTYITNAGDARSYGMETELAMKATPALELNAALTLGTAEITRGNPGIQRRAASIRGPEVMGVLKGDRLPGSQRYSATLGAQYTLRNLAGGSAYARVDAVRVGAAYADFMEEGSLQTGNYNMVNLRLGYKYGRYELVAFVNNAGNSDGIVSAVPNGNLLGTDVAYRVRPRTAGLTLRAGY